MTVMQMAIHADLYVVPPELVMNFDQTRVPFVPAPKYHWTPKGLKDVGVNGFGEKRQITVTPMTTAAGQSFPLQVCFSLLSSIVIGAEFATE
jgi:hypothetical protein